MDTPTSTAGATESRTYRIGDVTYRLEPASFVQHQWLADGPLNGLDFGGSLTQQQLEPIIRWQGTAILGMVLIPEGVTRAQKAASGIDAARELGTQLACELDYAEVRAIAHHFFLVDGYKNLFFFVDLQGLVERMPQDAAIETGSTPASASSPEAISPSATGSSCTPDPSTANSICVGNSNGS